MDKGNLTTGELFMIINALKAEQRTINNMMHDLERRGFHNGDQNVVMSRRMHELNDLINKLDPR